MPAAKKITEPRCTQVSVQWSVQGKVAIMEYGKITSGYSGSMSRTYEVPEDWTEDQIAEFQEAKRAELREHLDEIDNKEFEERFEQRDWK